MPCGEVCSYVRKIANESGLAYPELWKDIDCKMMMKRMAYRQHSVDYSPPNYPPENLIAEFTMHGQMPINELLFFAPESNTREQTFRKKHIDKLTRKIRQGERVSSYDIGSCVEDTVKRYIGEIKGKRGVVIGSERPWMEALLLTYGASNLTTIEYAKTKSEVDQIDVLTPYLFADRYLADAIDQFDFGATFSSLEHSGLGRYSDQLNPYGDLEAMAQIWCIIKPGGLFILGLPCSLDGRDQLVWNAHRIYGSERLPQMTANWRVIRVTTCKDIHKLFVLRKIE